MTWWIALRKGSIEVGQLKLKFNFNLLNSNCRDILDCIWSCYGKHRIVGHGVDFDLNDLDMDKG